MTSPINLNVRRGAALVFVSVGLVLAIRAADVIEATSPSGNAIASGTFVRAYGNAIGGTEYPLTPGSVSTTADGGYIALAHTDSPDGTSVNWLLKLDAFGNAQWRRMLGCTNPAEGDYALGLSAQQTTDGGYIVGGGMEGCGYSFRTLVQKLDPQGRVLWAFAYPAGTQGSTINQIRQAADGGYVAVGTVVDSDGLGALILKLDGSGTAQWQRRLNPAGSAGAYFNAVRQTADGGYFATGEFYVVGESYPYPTSVLVASFDSSGNVRWQKAYNNVDDNGAPSGLEHALAGIETSEGGFLVAGNWYSTPPGPFVQEDTGGALLLKLDSDGNIEWQRAYNGGVYCYFNGFNTTCSLITALPYSVHQTADGGYVLAGLGQLKLIDSVPQVPWLAKVDSAGNLLWQRFYYDLSPAGRPISQYFSSLAPTNDGGFMAVGFTEKNDPTGLGQLYVVKTDSAGLVPGSCQLHDATSLHAIDPALTAFDPALPIDAAVSQRNSLRFRAISTSAVLNPKCPG